MAGPAVSQCCAAPLNCGTLAEGQLDQAVIGQEGIAAVSQRRTALDVRFPETGTDVRGDRCFPQLAAAQTDACLAAAASGFCPSASWHWDVAWSRRYPVVAVRWVR